MTYTIRSYLTIGILILLAAVLFFWPRNVESAPTIMFTTQSGQVQFALEIADSPEEQEVGLMNRNHLADNQGMLFVFPQKQNVSFWMKDTLIPLDMIFIDENLRIVSITKNTQPCLNKADNDCPLYAAGKPIKYVLEIRGNLSTEKQIRVGNQAQLHL